MEGYKTRITPEKEAAVKALHDEFAQYDGFIFTDYRGMTVEQITKVRKNLMKSQGNYRVVKNRFAKIALNQLDHKGCDAHLKGPTGIALVKGDTTNVVAKELFAAKDDGAPIDIKGGLVDGQMLDAAQLEAYSKLPNREELLSILLGTMKAPVQKLAATLLAYVKKMGEGEPAKQEAAPAAN
ncbi:MAG: 50S ribosomal protein L10 [Sphaerochaeta sp.]|jgi:large subunit ribosomal protein L10|nr:50S ribosomal protein L10 [Sphaerochaeta sp.]